MVKYNENNTISIDGVEKQISLPYDRCLGKVVQKYNAIESDSFNTGDKKKYGLKKLLVFEILVVGQDCKNVSVGDCVAITSGVPIQLNLTLNYLVEGLGNEYAVVPESLMLFKTKENKYSELLQSHMVHAKFVRVYSENQTEYEKSTTDRLNNRMWVFEVLDNNGNEIEEGGHYIVDKFSTQNLYPLGNDEYICTLNNFKIKI